MCCMQEVRWKDREARFFGTQNEGIDHGGQEIIQNPQGLESR